jgi:hypothetical protein
MSAAEIIEQIKALPPEEQREVSRFMRAHVDSSSDSDSGAKAAAAEPIDSIADRIFDRYEPLFRKLAE